MFPGGVLVAEGSFLIAHSALTVGIMQVGIILKDDKNKYKVKYFLTSSLMHLYGLVYSRLCSAYLCADFTVTTTHSIF